MLTSGNTGGGEVWLWGVSVYQGWHERPPRVVFTCPW